MNKYMGTGDTNSGIPEEAKTFKAPDSISAKAVTETTEVKPQIFFDIRYCLQIGNVKTATEYLIRAQEEGTPIDKNLLQKEVKDAIDMARSTYERKQSKRELDENITIAEKLHEFAREQGIKVH